MKVVIKKSTQDKKKYMAIFTDNGKKIKSTHFGSAGMSDFTKNNIGKMKIGMINLVLEHLVAGCCGINQLLQLQ